eukprot:TRINITY_DN225_c0_g1_i2.p1 TRINITY_DN225_c0_g1~~TRINITY_DN225_c0_g1_i2.p1  ORF type:complete len:200 (-),score=46.44 TRINITY_DN225_c0_g1_i2:1084-1683(-)
MRDIAFLLLVIFIVAFINVNIKSVSATATISIYFNSTKDCQDFKDNVIVGPSNRCFPGTYDCNQYLSEDDEDDDGVENFEQYYLKYRLDYQTGALPPDFCNFINITNIDSKFVYEVKKFFYMAFYYEDTTTCEMANGFEHIHFTNNICHQDPSCFDEIIPLMTINSCEGVCETHTIGQNPEGLQEIRVFNSFYCPFGSK